MERSDGMELPGSASYYMQRGMGASGTGPGQQAGLNVQQNPYNFGNTNVAFQSSIGASSMMVPVEPSTVIPGANLGASHVAAPTGEIVKRKRGRPRKYGTDHGGASLALSSPLLSARPGTVGPSQKRGRGRPQGTGKKTPLASPGEWLSGSAGIGFNPHVIKVAVGEDIASKILSFSQHGLPRATCVLSANGSISKVTLRQPSTPGGAVTYEGHFEILCLSGSFMLTMDGGLPNVTGGLSVSLASPDGRVIGGGVGGLLIAASPAQVILGSFVWGGPRTKNNKGAGLEGSWNSNHQTAENSVTQGGLPPSHTHAPTSQLGIWSDSQSIDQRNIHVDIDLMRG